MAPASCHAGSSESREQIISKAQRFSWRPKSRRARLIKLSNPMLNLQPWHSLFPEPFPRGRKATHIQHRPAGNQKGRSCTKGSYRVYCPYTVQGHQQYTSPLQGPYTARQIQTELTHSLDWAIWALIEHTGNTQIHSRDDPANVEPWTYIL